MELGCAYCNFRSYSVHMMMEHRCNSYQNDKKLEEKKDKKNKS